MRGPATRLPLYADDQGLKAMIEYKKPITRDTADDKWMRESIDLVEKLWANVTDSVGTRY